MLLLLNASVNARLKCNVVFWAAWTLRLGNKLSLVEQEQPSLTVVPTPFKALPLTPYMWLPFFEHCQQQCRSSHIVVTCVGIRGFCRVSGRLSNVYQGRAGSPYDFESYISLHPFPSLIAVFHREIVSEVGALGVLGPTIKGNTTLFFPSSGTKWYGRKREQRCKGPTPSLCSRDYSELHQWNSGCNSKEPRSGLIGPGMVVVSSLSPGSCLQHSPWASQTICPPYSAFPLSSPNPHAGQVWLVLPACCQAQVTECSITSIPVCSRVTVEEQETWEWVFKSIFPLIWYPLEIPECNCSGLQGTAVIWLLIIELYLGYFAF